MHYLAAPQVGPAHVRRAAAGGAGDGLRRRRARLRRSRSSCATTTSPRRRCSSRATRSWTAASSRRARWAGAWSRPPAATIGAERPVPVLRGQPARAADRLLPGGELKVFRGRLIGRRQGRAAALARLARPALRDGRSRAARPLPVRARSRRAGGGGARRPSAADDPELNQELLACFTRQGTRGRFLTLDARDRRAAAGVAGVRAHHGAAAD